MNVGNPISRAPGATLAVTAGYVTWLLWRSAQHGLGEAAYDFYGLFYPNVVYALGRLAAGGHGLLWTPYQACGLPFLANSQVGLLYPGHLLFAVLPREAALLASALTHLALVGAGVYLLCREIGLGVPAALCGAFAFQLGQVTVQFAGWGPIHLSTWAWLSVAAWRAERLVHRPMVRNSVALGLVLTVQFLAGFIQISFLTYLLLVLRFAWAGLTRETDRPLALAASATLALALPVGLAAVMLVPALEMVRASIRSRPLAAGEIGPGFSWRLLLETVRSQVTIPFNVLVVLLAALAVLSTRHRALVVFFGLVLAGCVVLSTGPGSGLWELYARLPLAASFRGSGRLLWITHLAAAMLAALGAEVASRALGRAAPLLPLAMVANALLLGSVPYFGYRSGDLYDRNADAFAFVRARLTPQDRVHVVGKPRDVALGPKSPTWFRVPGIYDYEAQPPRRYAEFFTYLRTGRPLHDLSDWHWILDHQLPPTLQRPLFDRTAARYVLVDRDVDEVPQVLGAGVRLLAEIGGVRIYENEQALPRARWVPSATVIPDDDALRALASGAYDPRRTVVLDRVYPIATGTSGGGPATIIIDDPERVVVQVRAPSAAFLVLADTFYPGWAATVNGERREIMRADYAFRAVPLPAGESVVEFTYHPASVRRGLLLSAAGAALVITLLVWARRSVPSRR